MHENNETVSRGKMITSESSRAGGDTAKDVLPEKEWDRVDAAVDRALNWLASRQQADGSFPTVEMGQPGVTSLCMLAFMAHGHVPGAGKYANCLERATDYVLASQKENGLLSRVGPDGPQISRNLVHEIGEAAAYNHAISSLVLGELYGLNQSRKVGTNQKGRREVAGHDARDAAVDEESCRGPGRLAVCRHTRERSRLRFIRDGLGVDVFAIGAE